MKCKYCGYELEEKDLFCINCGHQAGDDVPEKNTRSASWIWTIILSVICASFFIAIVILGINLNDESESSDRYYRLWNDTKQNLFEAEKDLKKAQDALQKSQEESVITFWDSDIVLKITGFSNQDKSGNVLDYTLNSNNMRYLCVHYEVKWLVEKPDSKLYISFYNPDGTLEYNSSSSPSGYTWEASISEGTHSPGWGNSTESTYESGYYTILFTYENKIIAAERVYIN